MSPRINPPARRPVPVAFCLFALCFVVALIAAATAHAAEYKSVLCAGNNGSNGYGVGSNTPNFTISNYCGPAPDPAGDTASLMISENQDAGNMAEGAFAFYHWGYAPVGPLPDGGRRYS